MAAILVAAVAEPRELRVCADPNNLPFSNERREGFENRIAELVARDLHANLRYTWWAQRRGFLRSTLKAGLCDVVMGLPSDAEMALPTRPYYRSTYVFVSRADRHLDVRSLDDPRLATWRVGVQIIGDDYANAPPAHALARRGIVNNVVGYSVYGDYAQPNPPARIVEAVARGDVDVAIVWGPLAGYFADKQAVPMRVVPLLEETDKDGLRYAFDICIGIKKNREDLRDQVDQILIKRKKDIDAILDSYHVPRSRNAQAINVPGRQREEALTSIFKPITFQ